MKHLYDSLRGCAKEEEVKAEFCKFFKMKIFALRGIDHYTERVLFEFKYDRNFRNPENVARVLAQVMYYARMLKFGAGLTKYPLPRDEGLREVLRRQGRPLRLGPRPVHALPQARGGHIWIFNTEAQRHREIRKRRLAFAAGRFGGSELRRGF